LYELVASEGPTHEPMFEFSVKAREYSATGKGCHFYVKSMTNLHFYVTCFYWLVMILQ